MEEPNVSCPLAPLPGSPHPGVGSGTTPPPPVSRFPWLPTPPPTSGRPPVRRPTRTPGVTQPPRPPPESCLVDTSGFGSEPRLPQDVAQGPGPGLPTASAGFDSRDLRASGSQTDQPRVAHSGLVSKLVTSHQGPSPRSKPRHSTGWERYNLTLPPGIYDPRLRKEGPRLRQ